ncbi:acyl-CoA thioester hydrolase [Humidesulfovibrio mexicanus]|uniref:Acyl-CoA thioester hydrolase n=1 Tax=Humidesulfovibrio mexicanus TaxID=147047 RepID=A0A238ZCX7_9BACT|nr:thioesterase family protein [Humidesulfovibrio mexicanus]SNR81375.1 acyl-CoA thioester hydrolase [Humidesulfovibrio mexicanus]
MDFPKVFPAFDCWYGHRVSYGETDAMGVLYYGEYLHIFERARGQFLRERGMSYNVVEERGIILPVREAWCRYRVPARYDDLLWVHSGVAQWGRASITIVYECRTEDKSTLTAQGYTVHPTVNREGKPVPVPDWFKELCESRPTPSSLQA